MPSDTFPFDPNRMFLGSMEWMYLLEVLFRTAFMYFVALAAARVIGKRGMGQLTPFEYIVVIAMGSSSATPMLEVQIPLLHGAMVLITVVTIDTLLAKLAARSRRVNDILASQPTLLISNGKIDEQKLTDERIGREELNMMLRLHGVTDVQGVGTAYLEPSGDLSIYLTPQEEEKSGAQPGQSVLPAS